MARWGRVVGAWGLLVVAAACVDPFDPPSRVTENRVLAARAAVAGDPARAWPRPGETLDVTWLVVDEGAARPLSWVFAWCPAAPTVFGDPFCVDGEAPTVASLQGEPRHGAPEVSIQVPEDDALRGAEELLLMGLVCAEGSLVAPDGLPDDLQALPELCEGEEAKATPMVLAIPIQWGEETNHRPGIAELRRNGMPWPAPPEELLAAPVEGCPDETPSVPRVDLPADPEGELTLEVEVTEGSHEPYSETTTTGEEVQVTESLRIQHVTTAGELARLFSVLDDEGETEASVKWAPPAPEDRVASEQLVRFHVVVTDGRAGTTYASRALCLVSPS